MKTKKKIKPNNNFNLFTEMKYNNQPTTDERQALINRVHQMSKELKFKPGGTHSASKLSAQDCAPDSTDLTN